MVNEWCSLATQTQFFDESAIAVDVGGGKVLQQTTTLAHEEKQASTLVVVMLMCLEVLGEVGDSTTQHRNLNLGATGVLSG